MASDLILRAAARDVINTWGRHENEDVRMDLLHNDINAIPAVDAAPVVHARWVDNGEYAKGTISRSCSNCGDIQVHYEKYIPNYCPNCGARMDGGEADE